MDILSDKKLLDSIHKALSQSKTISQKEADKLIGW